MTKKKAIKEIISETVVNVKNIIKPKKKKKEVKETIHLVDTNINVSDIVKDRENKDTEVKIVITHKDKIAIRMKSTHKTYKAWNDLLLTKRELKGIPRVKYIIL